MFCCVHECLQKATEAIAYGWGEWIRIPGLVWGIGPILAYIFSYAFHALILEFIIYIPFGTKYAIDYPKSGTREEALVRTHDKVPIMKQFTTVVGELVGPTAIFNGALAYFLASTFLKQEIPLLPASPWHVVIDLILMHIVNDFFLYWGHRLQHEIPFLWENFHSVHHSVETPTPLGTIYIHSIDATLQGALPLLFTAMIFRTHPLTCYLHVFFRIGDNVVNHCGLEAPWINTLALKFLPGRATVSHHDAHHKYGHYGKNAKNYAEFFWVWDYIFGTLRPTPPARMDCC